MSELSIKAETNIKQLRKDRNITQEELAKTIGVTKLTILRWEKGDRVPKADKAQELADYFGVSVPYLLGYDVPKVPFETFTPREYNAWEDYQKLGLDKTELTFYAYEKMRNDKNFDNLYLEIISNYALSKQDDQIAIRQLARTTAKAHKGYFVNYKENN